MTPLFFFSACSNMRHMSKTALITGASRGIGHELAKLCAADGFRLVLIARDAAALKERARELRKLGAPDVLAIAADLSDPAAPETVFKRVRNKGWIVDTLVNNAGFATYGPFAKTDLTRELQELQLNVVALTHLTKLFLPDMIRRKRGAVLNVASIAAFLPGPLMAVYYASKAYVLHFSLALRHELRTSAVTVTTLCPGPTDTGFVKAAGMRKSRLFKRGTMDVADVARKGYEGMKRGKSVVIPGIVNKLQIFSLRLAPRAVVPYVVERKQRPS